MKLGEYVLIAQEHRYIAGKFVAETPTSLRLEDVYLISVDEEDVDPEAGPPPIGLDFTDESDVIAEKLTPWLILPSDMIGDVSAWSKELCKEAPAPKPKR